MMKKARYARSRLRENMLLGAAMVVKCFVEGAICVYVDVLQETRHGCDGNQGCYSCLGTGRPLAPEGTP